MLKTALLEGIALTLACKIAGFCSNQPRALLLPLIHIRS